VKYTNYLSLFFPGIDLRLPDDGAGKHGPLAGGIRNTCRREAGPVAGILPDNAGSAGPIPVRQGVSHARRYQQQRHRALQFQFMLLLNHKFSLRAFPENTGVTYVWNIRFMQ